jgi:DUF4097 and DUF4098 domain-containing protein YvlB
MTNGRPRRRSIFSGVLLIVLGVLFLLHNFRGGFPLWDIFLRWWPVLLIVWGLAKLYDHLRARQTGEAAPRTITGGDILLVFILVGLVSSIGGIDWLRQHPDHWGDLGVPWAQPYSFNEEIPAKAVAADSRIAIRTNRGDIAVRPEEAAEIRVLVKKTVRESDESRAKGHAQQVSVAIVQTGDGYEVRPQSQGTGLQVDLEVHVPKRSSVNLWTDRGAVQVTGLAGSVTAHGERGEIEIRDTGGDVSVEQARGDVHIVGARGNVKLSGKGGQIEIADVNGEAVVEGEFYGPIRIEKAARGARFISRRTDLTITQLAGRIDTGSGRLEISNAPGNLTLATRKYDVVLENVTGRVHIENRDGDVQLRFSQPPREEVEVTNASGSIELVLPPTSTFEVQAETRKGDIECEFSELAPQKKKLHGDTKLEGKLGAKGPLLRLKTSYGTIRLRKSS